MSNRTTQGELEQIVGVINTMLGVEDYGLDRSNGGTRLVRDGGAREVSPRLPAGELAQWMRAFIKGIDAADQRIITADRKQEAHA
jgi:hypothetical protein